MPQAKRGMQWRACVEGTSPSPRICHGMPLERDCRVATRPSLSANLACSSLRCSRSALNSPSSSPTTSSTCLLALARRPCAVLKSSLVSFNSPERSLMNSSRARSSTWAKASAEFACRSGIPRGKTPPPPRGESRDRVEGKITKIEIQNFASARSHFWLRFCISICVSRSCFSFPPCSLLAKELANCSFNATV